VFVGSGEPSQFEEAVIRRNIGDRSSLAARLAQGEAGVDQPFTEHASLRTHAPDLIERVAQAALAQSDDPANPDERHLGAEAQAEVRFRALNDLPSPRRRERRRLDFAFGDRNHAATLRPRATGWELDNVPAMDWKN